MFFDGKSGYFGDCTMEMDHIRRCFKKYHLGDSSFGEIMSRDQSSRLPRCL